MVGDTVISQYKHPGMGLCDIVGTNYTMGPDGPVSGTVDMVSRYSPEVHTVDVFDVKVLFFNAEARARFNFGEEPDLVY
jgi:hypothetical protein